ncbi:MAG: SRPBCC family protein [Actinomycetota bacterium]
MPDLQTGSASIQVARPPDIVFAAITDLERMGEWSPESGDVRWLDGATAAALGVRFAGDNEVALGPIPLKRWTTESEITVFEPPSAFEFVAAGYTTWRFDLVEQDGGTRLTESFSYPPYTGVRRVTYGLLGARDRLILGGVERTLTAIKAHVEAA